MISVLTNSCQFAADPESESDGYFEITIFGEVTAYGFIKNGKAISQKSIEIVKNNTAVDIKFS